MAASIRRLRSLPSLRGPTCWSRAVRFSTPKTQTAEGRTMRATSLASAAKPEEEQGIQDAVAPRGSPRLMRQRLPSRQALWPEALQAGVSNALRPALQWCRGTWFYRQRLLGPVPDRILFSPTDTRLRKLDEADGFMRGRFRLGGHRLNIRQGSVFDVPPPSESFAAA